MQLRRGELGGKRRSDEVQACNRLARLRKIPARAEQPQNELKLRNIRLAVLNLCVRRVSDEVEPRNAEPRLIHRIVKKRVIVRHVRHADDGVVLRELRQVPQRNREIPRHDADLFAVGKFIV